MTTSPLSILVLGASYGLLPAMKLSLAGHAVTLVGRTDEIALMSQRVLAVHFPMRRSGGTITLRAHVSPNAAPNTLALRTPETTLPAQADLVILAMQEPQYAAPEVANLLARIAAARRPCLSIMNLPPPPFLARLGIVGKDATEGVYTSAVAWEAFDPALLTLACPDAQAVRQNSDDPGSLTVTLPSNFKAAPFGDIIAQKLLERLAHDMSHLKVPTSEGDVRPPVALLAHSSPQIALAKWPMLIAGNCRCLLPDRVRSIAEAIHDDVAISRAIYDEVSKLTIKLGAREADMVPFSAYAKAAIQLIRPSSLARALASGAKAVERIDRLVLNLLICHDISAVRIQTIVSLIDQRLADNRDHPA